MFSRRSCSTLILSDSMCRDLPQPTPDTTVVFYPGATVSRLMSKLKHHDLGKYQLLLVHVGTNDVANGSSPWDIMVLCSHLEGEAKRLAPNVTVAFSSILPRLRDDSLTAETVKTTNELLCHRFGMMRTLRAYRRFRHEGKIITSLYYKPESDGIHLSHGWQSETGEGGKEVLADAMRGFILNAPKKLGLIV